MNERTKQWLLKDDRREVVMKAHKRVGVVMNFRWFDREHYRCQMRVVGASEDGILDAFLANPECR